MITQNATIYCTRRCPLICISLAVTVHASVGMTANKLYWRGKCFPFQILGLSQTNDDFITPSRRTAPANSLYPWWLQKVCCRPRRLGPSQISGNYFDIVALDVDKSPRIINQHNHNLKQGHVRNKTESETACLHAACDFKTLLRVLVKHEIFNDNKHIMASTTWISLAAKHSLHQSHSYREEFLFLLQRQHKFKKIAKLLSAHNPRKLDFWICGGYGSLWAK